MFLFGCTLNVDMTNSNLPSHVKESHFITEYELTVHANNFALALKDNPTTVP